MQKYDKDIFDKNCIYIYANVYYFVAYMNKLIPEKGVWAPALTPSPNPLPGTGRRGCGLGKD